MIWQGPLIINFLALLGTWHQMMRILSAVLSPNEIFEKKLCKVCTLEPLVCLDSRTATYVLPQMWKVLEFLPDSLYYVTLTWMIFPSLRNHHKLKFYHQSRAVNFAKNAFLFQFKNTYSHLIYWDFVRFITSLILFLRMALFRQTELSCTSLYVMMN